MQQRLFLRLLGAPTVTSFSTRLTASPTPLRWRMRISSLACALGLLVVSGSYAQMPGEQPTMTNKNIVVTLLGTGSPDPNPARAGAATLIEAGGMRFLFDAGRSAAMRLAQIKVPLGSIDEIFLTHLHSDHVVGLPEVWLTGFINPNIGGRIGPLTVVGPQGTRSLVENMSKAFAADVKIRIEDQKVNPKNTELRSREFTFDGVVFDSKGVKISAFAVNHGDLIKPSFGYKLEYAGRSVLLSGDTKFDENLIKHGKNVDLIIHEVAEAPEEIKNMPWVVDILGHHTTAEEAGRVFSRTSPKLAVYTHLVLLSTPKFKSVSVSQIEEKTRKTYTGPLVVGEDLMRFTIGDDVQMTRAEASR